MNTHSFSFKLRLGMFIVGGLALFIIGIFIIGKEKNYFDPVFKLTTTFNNVSGLEVGSNVRFTGINVGTVDNISINSNSTVQVDMLIRKDVQKFIKTNSIASIGSAGIVGDRTLSIMQVAANAPPAKDGDQLASKEPIETDKIIEDLKDTVDSANIFVKQAQQIASKVNSGNGTVAKMLNDPKMAKNINQTVINIRDGTKTLEENMVAAKDSFLLRGAYRRQAKREAKARKIAEREAAKRLEQDQAQQQK